MALSKGLAPDMVLTGLDEVFFSVFNREPMPQMADVTDGMIFIQDSTDRSGVITEQFKDAGLWEERAEREDLTEGTARADNKRTFTVAAFAQVIPISKHYFDDEQYGTIKETITKMAQKGMLTDRKQGFGIYRNAFGTTLTNDGAALVSASHTNLNSDTIDNYITAGLDESSVNTAINELIEQKDQAGDVVGFEASCLFVPNRLFKTAAEILDSELQSDTANNNINVYSSKYGIYLKQSSYIGSALSGSDTAWFMLSRDHTIKRWKRQEIVTDLVDYKYASNFDYKYKAEFRNVYGAISYEGVIGSDGTT